MTSTHGWCTGNAIADGTTNYSELAFFFFLQTLRQWVLPTGKPRLDRCYPRLDLPHGQVFLGLRTARDLFRSHPHLTRLYGAFSPADMTRDPVFGFPAADLPDVASTVDADAEVPCAGGEPLTTDPFEPRGLDRQPALLTPRGILQAMSCH